MTTSPEARPGALVEDNALWYRKAVGHIPNFLAKLTFFSLKNGSKLHITVTGPRWYPADLK